MLALSGTAVSGSLLCPMDRPQNIYCQLLCGFHRVSEGRCTEQKNVIPFSTDIYSPVFEGYRDGILETINHDFHGASMRKQLLQLHARGMYV